jgi:hypothetical protein
MEIILSLVFVGALLGLCAYVLSAAFRITAKDYAHYDWRVLVGSLVVLIIAFWSLPLVVIKDTFSPAFAIVRDLHLDSLRPAPYRPNAGYFDYFYQLLARFALFTFIASAIFAWVAHCLILMFRRRRGQA